jgi:hypothetical protein
MDNQNLLKLINRESSQAYWFGCAAGAVVGIGLGVMIGVGW